jgi:ADP-heptose:LPS heptosyltransferase
MIQSIRKAYPQHPLLLLNWQASNRLRDFPPEKLLFLTRLFPNETFVVALSADTSEEVSQILSAYGNNVFNLTPLMKSLEDYLTVLANCDGVISTDTAAIHIAEGFDIPALALFGPTLDDLWIRYHRNTIPLRASYAGKTCNSPCGLTKNSKDGCPETVSLGSRYSPCLLSITDEDIGSGFRDLLKVLLLKRRKIS